MSADNNSTVPDQNDEAGDKVGPDLEENKNDWLEAFKDSKPDDGPRDSSHGAVQTAPVKLQRKGTMNRTKGFIMGQLDTLNRKRAIEAPI